MVTEIKETKKQIEEVLSMVGHYLPQNHEQAKELADIMVNRFNNTLKPGESPRGLLDIVAVYCDPQWVYRYTDDEMEKMYTKVSIFNGKRNLNIFK